MMMTWQTNWKKILELLLCFTEQGLPRPNTHLLAYFSQGVRGGVRGRVPFHRGRVRGNGPLLGRARKQIQRRRRQEGHPLREMKMKLMIENPWMALGKLTLYLPKTCPQQTG